MPFIGADAWGSSDLIKLCGADCEGYYFSTHYAADAATETTRKFIAGYKARYGATPDDVAALTYDSFGLLFQALKRRPERPPGCSRRPGENSEYEGVTGICSLKKASGDPIKKRGDFENQGWEVYMVCECQTLTAC